MNKKLSIITINYNNLEGLKSTVESVVNQTWQKFEYIIIDGGSTDGSAEYIESQRTHIDYWVSEPDKGIYNAMNKGIAKATGEYLLFLNSGDHLFDNETISKCNVHLNLYDLITFDIQMIERKISKIVSYPDRLRFSNLFADMICHQSTFHKNELFDTVGLYDENMKFVSDWKFLILALFKYNCSYTRIKETLATYYLDGISSDEINREMLLYEKRQVLEENFNEYILDYEELFSNRELVKSNRHKMLIEIEKTLFGKKTMSVLLRIYIILFSKKKINEIIN